MGEFLRPQRLAFAPCELTFIWIPIEASSVMILLDDKVCLITGAGRNIGRGIARVFAAHNATVIVNDLDADIAKRVTDELPTPADQQHGSIMADVTDESSVQQMQDQILDGFGELDVLVNNVGYSVRENVLNTEAKEWEDVLQRNLTSTFLCTKYLGETLAETGGGSIINLASQLGHVPKPNNLSYCTAKAGILNFTRQAALDLARSQIRVNSISPGRIGSPVGEESIPADRDTHNIPLGRIGRPEDVGNVALFLASDLAAYVTAVDIPVHGGERSYELTPG